MLSSITPMEWILGGVAALGLLVFILFLSPFLLRMRSKERLSLRVALRGMFAYPRKPGP